MLPKVVPHKDTLGNPGSWRRAPPDSLATCTHNEHVRTHIITVNVPYLVVGIAEAHALTVAVALQAFLIPHAVVVP